MINVYGFELTPMQLFGIGLLLLFAGVMMLFEIRKPRR